MTEEQTPEVTAEDEQTEEETPEVVDAEIVTDTVETSEESTSEEVDVEILDADETVSAESVDSSADEDEVAFLDDDDDEDVEVIDASIIRSLETKIEELTASLEEAQQQGRQYKDRMLRGAADYENFRKRSTRDREEAVARTQEKVIVDFLPVIDNLERALQHIPEGEDEQGTVVEGVRMVLRHFKGQLQKFGVAGFESVGEPFNPERHEAIQQRDTEDHPNNTVVEAYQRGYLINDKLLRPAMVVVAKNPNG